VTEPFVYLGGQQPVLDKPTLVVMLTGWIDASGAAAAAMSALDEECAATTIAIFDGDTFIDYRARRPTMQLREGVNTNLEWPEIEVKAGRDLDGHEVLLLTGPEPDMAWRLFSRSVGELALQLGVERMVALGAYPFATPHTRPARLSMTSPSRELAASLSLLKNSVDVPAGVAAVLEHALHERHIDALGVWVQVPHYIASMAYPAATVALLGGLTQVSGVRIDAAEARRETVIQRHRLDELVASNDEHTAMVAQLESLYDAAEQNAGGPTILSAADIPTADELGAEFERFLRDQNGS
jgi:PAC2 family